MKIKFGVEDVEGVFKRYRSTRVGVNHARIDRRMERGQSRLALLNKAYTLTQDFALGAITAILDQVANDRLKLRA